MPCVLADLKINPPPKSPTHQGGERKARGAWKLRQPEKRWLVCLSFWQWLWRKCPPDRLGVISAGRTGRESLRVRAVDIEALATKSRATHPSTLRKRGRASRPAFPPGRPRPCQSPAALFGPSRRLLAGLWLSCSAFPPPVAEPPSPAAVCKPSSLPAAFLFLHGGLP